MTHAPRLLIYILLLFLGIVGGCGTKDEFLLAMDDQYAQNERGNGDVSNVVETFYPVGTPSLHALRSLKNRGFEITEFSENGFRKWPDGEWWDYYDKVHKKSARASEK